MKKKVIILINLIFIFVIVSSVYLYLQSIRFLNTNDKILTIKAEEFSNGNYNLNSRKLAEDEFGIYSYTTAFNTNELPEVNDQYTIIVSRISAQSFKIFLNGVYLGSAGDYEGINSSIWNGMFAFQFDKRILKDENIIKLDVVGLYEIGLNDYPVVITGNDLANKIKGYYHLVHKIAKSAAIGILTTCSLIMIIFYMIFKRSPRRKTFLYLGLALAFSLLYIIDLFSIEYLPVNFLLYKKTNITAIYVAMVFAVLGYIEYYKLPKLRIVAYGTLAISVMGAVFSRSMVQFKQWYDVYAVLLPLNIIVLKIAMLLQKRRSFSSKIVSICGSYVLLTLVPAIAYQALNNHNDMFYSIILVFLLPVCVSIAVLIMTEISRLQYMASNENKRFRYFYNKSITDGLTGLYNYSFMLDYLEKIEPAYTVFLFDIDNLKEINDNLGHLAGNNAILMITNTLKKLLPENAVAGRFGGDEFMVIVFGDSDTAKQTLEKVRIKVASHKLKSSELRVSLSIGMYKVTEEEAPGDIIDKADKAMYFAKKSGKNCLVDYAD